MASAICSERLCLERAHVRTRRPSRAEATADRRRRVYSPEAVRRGFGIWRPPYAARGSASSGRMCGPDVLPAQKPRRTDGGEFTRLRLYAEEPEAGDLWFFCNNFYVYLSKTLHKKNNQKGGFIHKGGLGGLQYPQKYCHNGNIFHDPSVLI